MKLEKLKEKLSKEIKLENLRKVKGENKNKHKSFFNPKIIGITGSVGKSSVAVLIHEYLKHLGKRSVLYSSCYVDSPCSYIRKDEAYEQAVKTKASLLSIMKEASAYEAEYIVLEVNESGISKGIFDEVDFDILVLTSINPRHNLEMYSEEEYVELKKRLFRNASKNTSFVIGLEDMDKSLFDEFLNMGSNTKYTYSTNYVTTIKGVSKDTITCLLTDLNKTINGMDLKVRLKNNDYVITSNSTFSYQSFNIMAALTVAYLIDLLDIPKFNEVVKNIKIPGRADTYQVNNRMIVIDTKLSYSLEYLNMLKEKGKISSIIVVVGALGSGFVTWDDTFNKGRHYQLRHETRKYAAELLNKYADFVYLTENDNANESVEAICKELQSYLTNCDSVIMLSREDAIKEAIKTSPNNSAILIAGRGNRRILCNSKNTIKLIKDSEVVEKLIKDLGW